MINTNQIYSIENRDQNGAVQSKKMEQLNGGYDEFIPDLERK